jgi:translation initiation factor 5B
MFQSLISNSTKSKKDKKKTKPSYDNDEFAVTNEDPPNSMESKKPVEVTAESLADEEWGPVKEKKRKGKGKKGNAVEEEEEAKVEEEKGTLIRNLLTEISTYDLSIAVVELSPTPAATSDDKVEAADELEGGGTKILSKKDKEKLKKEREKV